MLMQAYSALDRYDSIVDEGHQSLESMEDELLSGLDRIKNLDNFTADGTGMTEGEQNGMSNKVKIPWEYDGKTRWATGATHKEAIEKIVHTLERESKASKEGMGDAPLFRECAEKWLNECKRPKVRANTLYVYQHDMENHVLPVFGDRRIDRIRPSDIQAFLNTKQDLAKSTVKHIWLMLHGVFSFAKWDGYIDKDPTEEANRYTMSEKQTSRDALSKDEARDIIEHLDLLEGNDRVLMALLIYTGMRRSEVLGLRWEDIDFERGLIHVQRAATFLKNRPVVGKTKSKAGVRYIPLEAQLKAILTPVRQLNGYVIGQDELLTEKAYKRMWERIGKKIDLHGATAHVFRHTYITMAAPHVDMKTLQSMAGHADISTTMNRYAHGREDKIIEAGHVLNSMYN